jgi:hypothetical protein
VAEKGCGQGKELRENQPRIPAINILFQPETFAGILG